MSAAAAPTTQRTIHRIIRQSGHHWVGDGFRVKGLLSYDDRELARLTSPFLLLDYNAPYEFGPTDQPRGVGAHPHRGFETVTFAFDGAIAHHDSTGGGGVIRAGDVQWMTAGRGILHKEYHDAEWAQQGGTFHMAQLWVNLPAAAKMTAPGYQPLTAEQIGSVELPCGAGTVRVVAGEFDGHRGPARTQTPINLWDVRLHPGASMTSAFAPSDSVAVLVIAGTATINGQDAVDGELVVFERDGGPITIATDAGTRFLVLDGEPIDEPIVGYGPFVMNTPAEIRQAFADFERGDFGRLD
jgi:quercetin 2,3-dioxygenase